MGMNMMAEFLQSQEEREFSEKVSQLKRRGYRYIRVHYLGKGPAETIKLQGARVIEAYETVDDVTQEMTLETREGAGAIFFQHDRQTGRPMADIWDDEDGFNRLFIAKHLDSLLDVTDAELKKEISLLQHKKYSAAEARKRQLRKQMERAQLEIDQIDESETETEKKEKAIPRKPKRLVEEDDDGSPSTVGLT